MPASVPSKLQKPPKNNVQLERESEYPGSPYYDGFVDTWIEGELDELLFLKTMDVSHHRVKSVLNLETEK